MLNDPKRNSLFRHFFDVGEKQFMDELVSMAINNYSFDVIKFDEWCHTHHGYKEKTHGSCLDFVKYKWGEDAANFLLSLLGG